jgi:hypothetical protein
MIGDNDTIILRFMSVGIALNPPLPFRERAGVRVVYVSHLPLTLTLSPQGRGESHSPYKVQKPESWIAS